MEGVKGSLCPAVDGEGWVMMMNAYHPTCVKLAHPGQFTDVQIGLDNGGTIL